jgi:LacI family transcriptional regulator
MDIFAGIQRYTEEHKIWQCTVDPFFASTARSEQVLPYDGVIARATHEMAAAAAQARIPIVNVWTGSPTRNLPSVLPDFAACGRIAAEHLYQRGYRRFALHGLQRHAGTRQALEGFSAVARAAGCPVSTWLFSIQCDNSARHWIRHRLQMDQWLKAREGSIGVFVTQDIFARYLANACARLGLAIPQDIALIGYGNEPLICLHPEPSLSSVDTGFDRVGYQAAELLDRLMSGKRPPQAPLLIQPTGLVVRKSTDQYLVDDPMVCSALQYIAQCAGSPVRAKSIAAHVHTTVRTLERHFREAIGRTMEEEIMRLRLEGARRLLIERDSSIKQVAQECGFLRAKYFHHVFRRAEGVTPLQYRRMHSLPNRK